jgi:integrase
MRCRPKGEFAFGGVRLGLIVEPTGHQSRTAQPILRLTACATTGAIYVSPAFPGVTGPSKDSFEAFAAEFLKHQERRISSQVAKGKLSQAEYNRQEGIVEQHLKPFFGEMKLASIRKPDVLSYIHRRTGKVSDGTVIKETNVLKRLLNLALDLEKIPTNPAQRAPLPQAPEGRVRWLTNDELHKVLKACRLPPVKNEKGEWEEQQQWLQHAAGLAVALGTRRGELLNITLPDVDLDTRTILLRKTKNGKVRPAFVNDLALQVLTVMRVPERKKKRDRGLLFSGFTPEQFSMRFIRACRSVGVEDFSAHDLRHTFASHHKQNGTDLYELQKLLGHSDPRMTARYAHLGEVRLAKVAENLNGVLTLPAPESESA